MCKLIMVLVGVFFWECTYAATPQMQWVVVTPPAFRVALNPLIDHRRAAGFKVVVVETTNVLSADQIRQGNGRPLLGFLTELYASIEQPSYVLLVGSPRPADAATAEQTVVPALTGTIGRMKGQPSDHGYAGAGKDGAPRALIGRFPARDIQEVRNMVEKTLTLERNDQPGPWQHRLFVLMGNPGGNTETERQIAESLIQNAATARFQRFTGPWDVRTIFHSSLSPFCVPDHSLREVALRYLEEGALFSVYLGHSSSSNLWSTGGGFLTCEDWTTLKIVHGPGVLFSCGCFSCQLGHRETDGYGLAAIRNPRGPAAVIGAHAESYAAFGQLALDGLLQAVSASRSPTRLGQYWLAVKTALERGHMDRLTFYLYDQTDGSRGKTPFEVQRAEHLEMWMLLGDPALTLPVPAMDVRVEVSGQVAAGERLSVKGAVPETLSGAGVRVTLERPLNSLPADLEPLNDLATRNQIMMRNHQRANMFTLAAEETKANGNRFECALKVPAQLPWSNVLIRAFAVRGSAADVGVVTLKVVSP